VRTKFICVVLVGCSLLVVDWLTLWPTPTRGADRRATYQIRQVRQAMKQVEPLARPLPKPQPGDWLSRHREPGQSFEQYVWSDPITPRGSRRVIYVQPLGDFTPKQRQIVELSAEYMRIYFNREVRIKEDIPLSKIPQRARRTHPTWDVKQILTTYVLHDLLKPQLPRDGAAYIALTASDLWPGEGWNFVFGQASLRDRVGVWSIHRNGNVDGDEDEYRNVLRRTLKVATHETGHIFSMRHCIAHECNMCGSNHLAESDRHPLHLCPQCAGKIWWATAAEPASRYEKLHDFCERHGLTDEAAFFEAARKLLTADAGQ